MQQSTIIAALKLKEGEKKLGLFEITLRGGKSLRISTVTFIHDVLYFTRENLDVEFNEGFVELNEVQMIRSKKS